MDQKEALEYLDDMQRLSARTALYSVLPRQAAIIGGVLALCGTLYNRWLIGTWDFGQLAQIDQGIRQRIILVWVVIAIAAISLEFVLAIRDAKASGLSPVERPARQAFFSLFPAILVAAVLTVRLLQPDLFSVETSRLLVPLWLLCYGTGIYTAGIFSVRIPRLLGLTFLALGVISLFCFDRYGLVFVGLSFGILHILFGIAVIRTYPSVQKTSAVETAV